MPEEIVVHDAVIELEERCEGLEVGEEIQLTLGASKIMDFTVASRITATVSVKPVCCQK